MLKVVQTLRGTMQAAYRTWLTAAALLGMLTIAGCNNSPYPDGSAQANTLYTAFNQRSPRYLDPTSSYSSNETPFTYQIYEPLYGYHYLKRPYELVPKTAQQVV